MVEQELFPLGEELQTGELVGRTINVTSVVEFDPGSRYLVVCRVEGPVGEEELALLSNLVGARLEALLGGARFEVVVTELDVFMNFYRFDPLPRPLPPTPSL